jgi:hypothetical protein
MGKTHEPLHLVKWSFVHWKIMGKPTIFMWIIIFFNGVLNMAAFRNYEVMLGQTMHYFV